MQSQRITRVNELLKREIASVLYRELTEEGADLAAVTITRVAISPNLRQARVSVSVRGDAAAWSRVAVLLEWHRAAIQEHLRRRVILKYTPVLHFARDESLAQGDRVLQILNELPNPGAPEESAP